MAGGCGQEADGIVADPAAKWRPCGQVRRAGPCGRRHNVVVFSRREAVWAGSATPLIATSPFRAMVAEGHYSGFRRCSRGLGEAMFSGWAWVAWGYPGGSPEARLSIPVTYLRHILGDPCIPPYHTFLAPGTHLRITQSPLRWHTKNTTSVH